MGIVAVIVSLAALYVSLAAATNNRAAVHFRRAVTLYAAHRIQEGDAEMERGLALRRRADRLLMQRAAD